MFDCRGVALAPEHPSNILIHAPVFAIIMVAYPREIDFHQITSARNSSFLELPSFVLQAVGVVAFDY